MINAYIAMAMIKGNLCNIVLHCCQICNNIAFNITVKVDFLKKLVCTAILINSILVLEITYFKGNENSLKVSM